MNILLCSVGRRPYLIRWFQEALRDNGLEGKVIAADADPTSAAKAFADILVQAPPASDGSYAGWLKDVMDEMNIELAVSVNDFELSQWARFPTTEEWAPLVRLNPSTQELVEDKLSMAEKLNDLGILSPQTWTGTLALGLADRGINYVTKGRFGSASRGLRFAPFQELPEAILSAIGEVTTQQGEAALSQKDFRPEDLVIVQEQVVGTEYGLDIISNLKGDYKGVLARQKIAMRSGETDRAITVDPTQFRDLARNLSRAVPHPGTMDVDVIVDEDGQIFVIDINPRIGGGYPFSHLAGARIPNAYVAWSSDNSVDDRWLKSEIGKIGSKYVEVVEVE